MNTTVFEQQKKEKELNYSKICEQDYGIVCEPGFNVDSEKCLWEVTLRLRLKDQ